MTRRSRTRTSVGTAASAAAVGEASIRVLVHGPRLGSALIADHGADNGWRRRGASPRARRAVPRPMNVGTGGNGTNAGCLLLVSATKVANAGRARGGGDWGVGRTGDRDREDVSRRRRRALDSAARS